MRSIKGVVQVDAFKPGAVIDGIVRVNAKARTRILRLNLVRMGSPLPPALPQTETEEDPGGGSFSNLAAGLGSSSAPAITTDNAGNVTAVWYSDGPSAGLWMSTKEFDSNTWSTATYLGFSGSTAWLPSIAADEEGGLHLVWEESVGNGLEIHYALGAWDETGSSVSWETPQALSSGGFAYNAQIGVTVWNGSSQLHVTWIQVEQINETNSVSRVMHAQGAGATGAFGSVIELAQTTAFLVLTGATANAAVPVVGVGYIAHECDGNAEHCAELKYQECSVSVANGNCALANWGGAGVASASEANSPALAFDSEGNAHVVWQGAGSGYTIAQRIKQRSGGWSAVTEFTNESGTGDWEPMPIVGAGATDNVYIGWNHFFSTPYELRLAHYNGSWQSTQVVSLSVIGFGNRWGSIAVAASGVGHLVWNGTGGQIYYTTLGIAAPTPTPTATATYTATATPTQTATPTVTPTNTPIPTVTPNTGGVWALSLTSCRMDTQYVYQNDNRFVIWYQKDPPVDGPDCTIINGDAALYLETIGEGTQLAFDQYQQMGYEMPTPSPYQIFVVPVIAQGPAITYMPNYTFINNDISKTATGTDLKALAAHELFHASQ